MSKKAGSPDLNAKKFLVNWLVSKYGKAAHERGDWTPGDVAEIMEEYSKYREGQTILSIRRIDPKSVIKRMALGAAIGFIIISFFVLSVDEPNPEWGKWWRIRPLVITPLATAFGILSFYLADIIRPRKT